MSRAALAFCFALVLLAGSAASARAQTAEAGAQSLLFAPGARGEGMGRAFVAIADDANAVWWNPGALAFTREHDVSFMYAPLVPDLVGDVSFSYLSYVQQKEGWGGIGIGLAYLSYGKSEATDVDGNVIGEFTSYEIAPTLAYGTELMPNLGFGVALKFVRVDLAPEEVTQDQSAGRGSTFAADIAALYKVPKWRSSVGLAIVNLGPSISFIDVDQSDPLGRMVRLGAACSPLSNAIHRVSVSGQLDQTIIHSDDLDRNESRIFHMGVEYEFNHLAAVRIGYINDSGFAEDRSPSPKNMFRSGFFGSPFFAYGLGFSFRGVRVDYASFPQSEFLEHVNRFSASYHF